MRACVFVCVFVHAHRSVHACAHVIIGIVPSSGHGPIPTCISFAILHCLVSATQVALVGPRHHISFSMPLSDTPDTRCAETWAPG